MTFTLGTGRVSAPAASNTWSPTVGMGCIALFLLPFAGVGLFAAVQGIQRASVGNWREMLFFGLFATVFGGVGFGGLAAVLIGRRTLREQDALKARFPKEPWLWQKDWASGRVEDASRRTLWMSWIFATLWNLVSWPSGFLGVRAALQEGNRAGWVALLFPVAGAGLLTWAIRTTIRCQKYGWSRFELSTLPGVIGHTLAGTVRVSTAMHPVENFEATLTCVRRVTTGGKDSSTSESIVWQEEQLVRGEPSRDPTGLGTAIPVAFRLPADASPCDSSNPNDRILWLLKLCAGVPGVDYESLFEVPVFRTPASDRPLSADEDRMTRQQLVTADYQQPADSRISVTVNRRGTEINFPAMRNPGAAVGSAIFTALWLAIAWGLVHFKAPILFPLVVGGFGLLLIYGTLELWLRVTRVTVDATALSLASGYLIPGGERRIAANQIDDVSTAIGMQAGSTPYYDVVVLRRDQKKMIVGHWVRNKREAEWLALKIRTAAGLGASRSQPSALSA